VFKTNGMNMYKLPIRRPPHRDFVAQVTSWQHQRPPTQTRLITRWLIPPPPPKPPFGPLNLAHSTTNYVNSHDCTEQCRAATNVRRLQRTQLQPTMATPVWNDSRTIDKYFSFINATNRECLPLSNLVLTSFYNSKFLRSAHRVHS